MDKQIINNIKYKPAFSSGQWPKNLKGKTAHTDPYFQHSLKIFYDDSYDKEEYVKNQIYKKYTNNK